MQVPGRQTWERGRIGFLSPPLGVLQCRAGSLPGGLPESFSPHKAVPEMGRSCQ